MQPKKNTFTFIDLFSGIGGFRLAFNKLGGECINFSEVNTDAINTYCANFSETPTLNLGDITKIKNLPYHDILTAGVPCQSWSIAGKNLGFDDDRGQLWNDTIFLLNQSRPKAFIFENVKGLADPRNKNALSYILKRINDAGYHSKTLLINASDYGAPQDRVRVYIIGFQQEGYLKKFRLPPPNINNTRLADIIQEKIEKIENPIVTTNQLSLLSEDYDPNLFFFEKDRKNDFFLFNDIRNGPTTIHSWDLIKTTNRQKDICLLILKNRRKRLYGKLDGNPLSIHHLKMLDDSIHIDELEELVQIGILKKVEYQHSINNHIDTHFSENELKILKHEKLGLITLDALKSCKEIKKHRLSIELLISKLIEKNILKCTEVRYEFRYTKISTGINGINRIFLPKSKNFPTLVASDTNDYIALKNIDAETEDAYKEIFLKEIFEPKLFRKITKEEACLIQGFPKDFKLPESRSRWMKLIGNSIAVPVIYVLGNAIIETGCLDINNAIKAA